MICVPESDPGLFLRYWNLPEETAQAAARRLVLHRRLRALRRRRLPLVPRPRDDIIKSFGYRVSPYEVERVLKSHPAVADCACIGEEVEPDKRLVVAYVIAHAGATVTPEELLAFGREHLASYKAPKVVYLAREFPRTRNGKILRRDISPSIALARSVG